ncbi:MAG: phospho-N-acetylmuramoyl-pentapeptide-transferase [Bacillota bacterium]
MSLGLCIVSGPLLIPLLRRLKFGQSVRSDGPRRHLVKAGTPTMGGIMFLISTAIATLYVASPGVLVGTVLLVTLGHGLIGFADDFIKIVLRRPLGLKARHKLVGQALLGMVLAISVATYLGRATEVSIPFFSAVISLGLFFYFFVILMVMGFSNAVNLTDGLDGLAAGVTLFAALTYAVGMAWQGQNELAIFAGALAGGCLGFLAFNRHPAKVFMGDTGSLALGAGLASLAVLSGTELLLFIVGGVFVIETLSVIIQVLSFRLTGRRVFRMSPLHHHFELAGWPETKVVKVFWLWGIGFGLVGLAAYI